MVAGLNLALCLAKQATYMNPYLIESYAVQSLSIVLTNVQINVFHIYEFPTSWKGLKKKRMHPTCCIYLFFDLC